MRCGTAFDPDSLQEQIGELTKLTSESHFWSRSDAQEITRNLARLQERMDMLKQYEKEIEELETIAELLSLEDDRGLEKEFQERSEALREDLEKRRITLLLDEEYDESDAILNVHAGAGGLDSQDWAEMLYRMYLRWAERQDFKVQVLEVSQGEEAGIKSATVLIKGEYAYGLLKCERGVHRLVRISPFDTAKRRHTSFASVSVSPDLPKDVEVEIDPEDLRIDTFRSGGAGGQYVNMTDSAVRITHIPTGIVVSCQNERSQHMNREVAMQILRGRLYERMLQERQERLENIQGEKKEIGWGSQIRSYVFHPYTLVKDHRTNVEKGNVQAVIDGDIEEFIFAELRRRKQT
ncbi:MAG: Peptide chain release factor 2 [Synergistales bacterium 53_16]|nr:MAG: Peptide chain release factor 2 [Synergistales bacterium 53_16]KUL04955.1 MAG: Peptide chain release factor 2 [Synergistales bacterium 54_9]MDN5335550.1 peptide chain release factor 2 [Synergistales bacterium]